MGIFAHIKHPSSESSQEKENYVKIGTWGYFGSFLLGKLLWFHYNTLMIVT